MQLVKLSSITALAIIASNTLYAENYVAVEYLQYDENDNRVSVSAPTLSASYDIGTDYNIHADFVHDAVSGATPVWQSDTVTTSSGASGGGTVVNNTGDYVYKNQSFNEERNAGSLMLTTRFDNRDELYTGVDYSRESDFDSKSVSAEYMHYLDSSHNQSVNFGASFTYNEILASKGTNSGRRGDDDDDKSRQYKDDDDTGSGASQIEDSTSINLQAGFSQILSATSLAKAEAFAIFDNGYLTNPHSSVVRDYNTAVQRLVTEVRPDKRTAYGVNLKYITMLGEDVSLQGNYRFYTDDWNINSHTLNADGYYTLSKALTLGTGVRYYTQSQASFYNKEKNVFSNELFASSDERLSQFNALTYKGSIDYAYSHNISYNLGAEFYKQSTGLTATFFTTGLKYHF